MLLILTAFAFDAKPSTSSLHDTLVAGDLDGVREALAKGAEAEGRDALGTPL